MKKRLMAVVVTTIISLTMLVGCGDKGNNEAGDKVDDRTTITSLNGKMQIKVPKGWEDVEDKSEYDIRILNDDIGYNGMFVYTKEDVNEGTTPLNVLELQVEDLMSKREKVEKVEDIKTTEVDGKKISTALYSAEKDGSKNMYYFNLIEFTNNKDIFAVSIQTFLPEDLKKGRIEVDKIIQSAELL